MMAMKNAGHTKSAEFYAAMRSKALAMGMTTTDELGGFVRHDTYPNDMDF